MGRGQKTYLDWAAIGRSRKWLDYGLLCMYESAAIIVVGADTFVVDTFLNTLTWEGFEIYSPISGKTITVSGGSTSASDGDIIYIRNVEHPFKNETKSLSAGDPLSKSVRKPTNLFLGVRSGGSVYLFPTGGGSGATSRFLEEDFVPIEWAQDGTVAPAAAEDLISGNGSLKVRKFSASATNDIIIPWEVPDDIVVDAGIKFKVLGVFSDAGMTAQGMIFGLKGYSIGNNDPIGASWGTQVIVNPTGTYSQYDRLDSGFSSKVTIANLAQGELAMLSFSRLPLDVLDTYASIFAVYGLKIGWTRRTVL